MVNQRMVTLQASLTQVLVTAHAFVKRVLHSYIILVP